MAKLCDRATKLLKEIEGVVSQSDVTDWELRFLKSIQEQEIVFGSNGQVATMEKIEARVFPTDEDEEAI